MVVNFSELLALIPYLLRSVRLGKIFEARDAYCRSGKLPQKMIEKWSEKNVIKYFLIILGILYGVLEALPAMTKHIHIASYNLIERAMKKDQHGLFYAENMVDDYTEGLGFMIAYNFLENVILIYALKVQWQIVSEYNIFTEILLVSITWILLSNLNLISWIYLYQIQTQHFATLNSLRWIDFSVICSRSFLCIIFSTLKNIKDSAK